MSKSSPTAASYIALTDDPSTITKKIKRAVTDSDGEVLYRDDKPALSNLLSIYSLLSNEAIPVIEARYQGRGYGAFKNDLAEIVVNALTPIQQRLTELERDPSVALGVLARGADQAREQASAKMTLVRERMGLDLSALSSASS
jgi:tryptophanyl-tRNA synthetase